MKRARALQTHASNHCPHSIATIRVTWRCVTCEVTETVCKSCQEVIERKTEF
ncbi:MAG: hypothetical protein U1C58_06185 [Flavobacteriaceae bacterium]|nr:hypothetical protein [Flavobacteriaceae bacterium]MDZ4147853.1 hypothetical protein [Flavobacteriaceae bacterium]